MSNAVPQAVEATPQQDKVRLQAFAISLAAKRKEDIDARAASGVEILWKEDQEYCDGIDDANRADVATKPSTSNGRVLTQERDEKPVQSNVFVNITEPYVEMASARLADMLLPTDDRPFGLLPTPEPDMIGATKMDGDIQMPDGKVMPVADVAKKMLSEAGAKARRAENKIWDWLVQSNWHAEARTVIEDAARVGTGVMKGPFPKVFKKRAVTKDKATGATTIQIVQETIPKSKAIPVENLYPAANCGDDIHNGSRIWERDEITGKILEGLKDEADPQGNPIYIASEIDECIKEGPGKKYVEDKKADKTNAEREKFEIWYFHGLAGADDIRAAGCECDDGDSIPVEVTMVNDRVIKIARAVLDSGEFPYDVFRWKRRKGHWAGEGVSRQVRTAQRIVNAATRNMMDNAGLAAGPQIIVRASALTAANGRNEFVPRKVWMLDADADIQNSSDAMYVVQIPMMQEQLMAIINYGMSLAERVTSMPLLMQGQQGSATQTATGMQILNNNGSVVLRRHAKIFDDDIIERHIPRYYEWLLLYSDNEDEKGDFQIDARGSSALFERDQQNQSIAAMAAIVKDPDFKIDPAKWFAEKMKADRLDPTRFQYTDEEWEQRKSQMQGPPPDPRIQVADMKIKADQQDNMQELKFKADEAEKQRQHESAMKEQEFQIRLIEFANARGIGLDKAKTQLTDTALKLRTQAALAKQKGPQVATPATEPAGRAPNGEAFQK